MLLWLADLMSQHYRVFHVFHYLTLRTILSALTALIFALWFGPYMINWLRQHQLGQQVRQEGPQSHYSKAGTPTMGGAIILVAISVACLLWGDLSNRYFWIVWLVTLGFGLIGWVDDYRKIIKKNAKGLAGRWKYFYQSLVGLTAVSYLYLTASTPQETILAFPFFKNMLIPLGLFYIVLSYLVVLPARETWHSTLGV